MPRDYREYLRPDVVSRLQNMELRARLVVEGFITGLHRSPYHGFSVEFAEHRQYMPGDELKRVDWNVYGRTNRFYGKQYEEETNLKAYLLLDASASMGFASPGNLTKFTYASYLAASLAYLLIQQRDAVGLAVFDEALRVYRPPRSTRSYLRALLQTLDMQQPSHTTRIGAPLHEVAERLHRRGLVILLSDLLDDPPSVMAALKHFRHDRHEVIVFHILDPLERTFDFPADAMFTDMETGETMPSQVAHVRRSYQAAVTEFVEEYKRKCRENGIDYVPIDTATTFDRALVEYLAKRRRME